MRFAAFCLVWFLAAVCAPATTILFSSSASGRTATNASLTALPDGSQFLIGSLSNPGAVSLSLGSVAAIQAAGGWTQFDGAKTTSNIFGNSGKLLGSATDDTAAASAFDGKDAYIMIFNTPSAGTATQIGIFRAISATPAWVFPTNLFGSPGDSRSFNMDDTSIAAVNGVGSVTSVPQQFVLGVIVPEPSSVGLALSAILGLAGYRRFRGVVFAD